MSFSWSIWVIILINFVHFPLVSGVDFRECLTEVRNGLWGSVGGTNYQGNSAPNISSALGITYHLCVKACGTGSEPFLWSVFSQQLGSWLLPSLALISQLPYGADNWLENLVSMLLTVGSPTLAAYSLALTALNRRWISRQLTKHGLHNTHAKSVAHILTILQQYPLKINPGNMLTSLIVLPENKDWWDRFARQLKCTPMWSLSAVTSMAWVVVAFVFTVIDSFTRDITSSMNANGQGIGSQWLWLMPVVAGWLQILPGCNFTLLKEVVDHANGTAWVSIHEKIALRSTVSDQCAISIPSKAYDDVCHDEYCTIPIYNYARLLPWAEAVGNVTQALHETSRHRCLSITHHTNTSSCNTSGTDGNQVDPFSFPLENLSSTEHNFMNSGLLGRVVIASLLALFLQWGTTGAAIIVHWFVPTYGLGCRTASSALYGILSTVVWIMLVVSSILAYYSTSIMKAKGTSKSARNHRRVSIFLRHLAKVIACFNAVWIVLSAIFQFSNFYDTCWCNSSILGLHSKAYVVIDFSLYNLTGMRVAWIGGMALAATSAIIYTFLVNLVI